MSFCFNNFIRHIFRISSCLCISLLLVISSAAACPLIDQRVDFNCDGQLRYAITGDSIVRGIGDRGNSGGYPARLNSRLEITQVENLGTPGISSLRLYRRFLRAIDRGKALTRKTNELDLLIVQVGTNDFWLRRPLKFTYRNLKRLKLFIETHLEQRDGVSPFVALSTLPPTKRDFQQSFVDDVNRILLGKSDELNVMMRFHNLNPAIISDDTLHPDARGYNIMSRRAMRGIRGPITAEMLKAQAQNQTEQNQDDSEL